MTLDNETPVNFIIRAFTPGGWQVDVGVTPDALGSSAGTIAEGLDNWLAINGFLQTLPGLEPGENKATISHVIRRNHKNKETGEVTPQIGFYADGPLEFKFGHMYLNTTDDIAQFEAQSGLKLDRLPVWEANQFPPKTDDSFQKYAVTVTTPFDFCKKQVGTRDNGMPDNEYRYFSLVNTDSGQPQPTAVKSSENSTESEGGHTEQQPDDLLPPTKSVINNIKVVQHKSGPALICSLTNVEMPLWMFSREPFRKAGFTECEAWTEVGQEYKPSVYIQAKVEECFEDGRRFLKLVEIEPSKTPMDYIEDIAAESAAPK